MTTLSRRRSDNSHQEMWHIYFGDVRLGQIGSAAFDEPIALPDGRKLVTLRDEWKAATEALLLVAEHGGATMLARIGMMRALNAGKPPPDHPSPRKKRAKVFRIIR